MRLDLRNIINTPGASVPFDYELDLSAVELNGDYPIPGPVRVAGTVRNAAGALTLTGTATTTLRLRCDRCLKQLLREHTAVLDCLLAERLEDEENDEIVLLENGALDLDELAYSAVILAMDTKILCSEDCKGLCSHCGANLNIGPCCCKPEPDPRFAALAQLLDDKTE
ncbi:MAG: DUF177 domain-containing protein [Oscillospiraceae bacterium]|nr:DUF177 domain-containing protein [Oscillospiraceae bacterium]